MSKTTIDTRKHKYNGEIGKFNDQNYEWLMQFSSNFTHAATLTFDFTKIWRFANSPKHNRVITQKEMIELLRKSFGCFVTKLNRSLYGNASWRHGEKLLLVGVIEGLYQEGKMHYHCAIGVPDDRLEIAKKKIIECWRDVPFSGHHNKVEDYRDAGWLGYINKEVKYLNRQNIDWDHVRVPASLLTHS
jgi:hypothetical protein